MINSSSLTQSGMDSSAPDPRREAIWKWCEYSLNLQLMALEPASADASFRRYFRAELASGPSLIVMDAPPENEDSRPFVAVAGLLADAGIRVPAIHAMDLNRGFILLSDFGSEVMLRRVQDTPTEAPEWYGAALSVLNKIQLSGSSSTLPDYDSEMVEQELALFPEWFCDRHLGLAFDAEQKAQWDVCIEYICQRWEKMPGGFTHRDYHSRNLMALEDFQLGVIDFQDAVAGPLAYDLVSLLKDCYVCWPESQRRDWLRQYWETARRELILSQSFNELERDFELCGVQRHLKVLGIFCRLFHRDGKSQYLGDLPLVRRYLLESLSSIPELGFLQQWLQGITLPEQN